VVERANVSSGFAGSGFICCGSYWYCSGGQRNHSSVAMKLPLALIKTLNLEIKQANYRVPVSSFVDRTSQ